VKLIKLTDTKKQMGKKLGRCFNVKWTGILAFMAKLLALFIDF